MTLGAADTTELDDDLLALIAAANGVPQTAPGLLAWIEGAAQTGRMEPALHAIAAALAELDAAELRALIASGNRAPQVTPSLLAWLERAAHWELDRRAGSDFPLQLPDATIDARENAASIAAAMILREQFAQDAPTVAALFDAIVGTLTGTPNRH